MMQFAARAAFIAAVTFCAFMHFLLAPMSLEQTQTDILRMHAELLSSLLAFVALCLTVMATLEPVSQSDEVAQNVLLPVLSLVFAFLWWFMLGIAGHWPLALRLFVALPLGYYVGGRRNIAKRELRAQYLRERR